MTANVNVTKLLFKRGNTVQNANYTGINGEITVDTQAKTLRIHDGVTAGGNVITAGGVVGSYSNTNAAAYIPTDPTITSLQSNAATQAVAINTVNANIGAFQTYANITLSTVANAASQETQINIINANVTAANAVISSLQSNAGSQATSIDTINANVGAYQTYANANAATQATSIDTINANLGSFQTYANIHFGDSNYGNTNVAAYLGAFNGNIIPSANVTYSLGDSTHQWRDLWVSNNTIYIGNTPIRVDGGNLLINNSPIVSGPASSLVNGAATFQLFANGESRSPDTIFAANGVSVINANGAVQGGIYNSGDANFFNIGASTGRGIKFYVDEETDGPLFFANGSVNVPGNLYSAAGVIGDVSMYGGTIAGTNPSWNNLTLTSQIEGYSYVQLPTDATANVANLRIHNDIGNVELVTGDGFSYNYWYFGKNGNLTIPGNINYANGVSILDGIGGAVNGNIVVGDSQIQFVANSSGDGYGLSTIRLVPYTPGYDSAIIIIDPTYPNHIHMRAGFEQDNAAANLFLGGEASHFNVEEGANPNVSIRSNYYTWTFATDGNLTIPGNIITTGNSTTIGTANASVVLNNNLQSASLTVQKHYQEFYENGDYNTSGDGADMFFANVGGQGQLNIQIIPNQGVYLRGLLNRIYTRFTDGDARFYYNYSNVRFVVNPSVEAIQGNLVSITRDAVDPEEFTITLDQLPVPDPFTVSNIDIIYDFVNTIGMDAYENAWGIGLDDQNLVFRTGRDIDLLATDDIDITGGSSLQLRLHKRDDQSPDSGVQIFTVDEGTEKPWTFSFGGDLFFPSAGAEFKIGTIDNNLRINTETNLRIYTDSLGVGHMFEFQNNGNLTIPGNINYANGVSILSGLGGGGVTGNILVDTSAIQFVASSSGDGNGYSTIRIIPDTNLEGTDQYLIIDPTAPGHIHIRAGGDQDNSSADLFLGGENSHFQIPSGANSSPYIKSNGYNWAFGTDGNLTIPGSINGANVISASTFVSNAFNVVTAGNLSITSQYGLGTTGTILEDNGTLELIAKGGGAVVAGWDSTYGNGLGNIATINFNEVGGEGIVLRTGNRAATEYNWNFDNTGNLTFPTGGSVTFDASAVSIIDGVTNINAVGTIGANVIQVLSDLTSFGASPAPVIYGFSSISTTGSAANEGNISASGNLVASQNAYVTGNVFAAQYNYANGVSISQSIQNGISNVRVLSSGGLVSINVGGASNIALFTTTGASIGGTLSTSGFTATGAVTLATASGNINIGASQTTGHVNMGGTAQTGTILIGQSTYSQTINIGHGITGSGNTKTIQIGENGAAGSATLIDIGPATASATGTVTFNTGTVVTIANTGSNALSVAGNITGGNVTAAQYNFANGVNILSTVGAGSYGNTEVAAYLPTYSGNVGAVRVQVTNALDFMYGGYPYMGWQLSGSDTLKLRTNISSGDYTNDAVIVDRQSLAVNVVATLTAGNIITTSGVFWANGSAYATSGGSYGNTQVAAYLPTYTGNIGAGNVNVTSTVYAANIVTSGTSGNISGVNVISANTFVFAANGINILSAAGGNYGNTQVAAYLLTWPNIDSNILNATSANITTLRAPNFNSANAVISGGYISALTNASIITATITTLNSTGGNITTLRVTNFGTANAVITGGYINSLANLTATTAVFTNFSTGNAVISGGYISALTNAYITTSAITNFSTANAVITGGYASGLANVTATGNVTAGNLIGYGSNTSIIAGAYTSTFDNVGNVILPNAYVSGNTTVMGIAPGYAPNRPAFRVYGNGAVPIWHNTANVNLKGSAITVDHNQGNYFDSTTGKFTAPVSGLYITTLQARVGDNNGLNQIAVLKNGNNSGANVVCFWETDTNTGTATHFGTSGVVVLAPGDFLSANILAGNINFDGNDSWTVTYLG